jgi:ATP-binding cassette subfamily C protein CydD
MNAGLSRSRPTAIAVPDMDAGRTSWMTAQIALGRRTALPSILLSLAAVPLAVAQAWIVAAILGTVLLGQSPRYPIPLGAGFLACALLRAGLTLLAERASAAAGATGRHRLRHDILQRLLDAGPGRLRGRHSGELVALVIDQIEALEGLFARWIPAAALAVAAPAVIAIAVLLTDRFAGVVLITAGLLMPIAMAISGIGAAAATRSQFTALTRLQTRFLDRVRGIATIVLAGRAEDEALALAAAAAELRRRTMRVLRVAFLSSSALDLAMAGSLIILALHDAAVLLPGVHPNPARALFALLLVPEFFAPLRAYAAAYQDRMQARIVAESVAQLPDPEPITAPARPIRTIEAHGVTVAFEDVTLTWDAARGPALDSITCRIPAGETLIVAGPSGAGKSSLIELLLGFARPDQGAITLNGMRIETIVPAALARMTAWIGQRPLLFAGTLRDNIRFGRPEATDAEVSDAAAKAQLAKLIESLPQGLDTPIGESGHGLSGGQAQRVAIARAFLRNAPLLLLDEPTAHLDPATEAEVLESLKRLAIGRTVILVAHSAAAQAFPGRRIDLRHGRLLGTAARGAA